MPKLSLTVCSFPNRLFWWLLNFAKKMTNSMPKLQVSWLNLNLCHPRWLFGPGGPFSFWIAFKFFPNRLLWWLNLSKRWQSSILFTNFGQDHLFYNVVHASFPWVVTDNSLFPSFSRTKSTFSIPLLQSGKEVYQWMSFSMVEWKLEVGFCLSCRFSQKVLRSCLKRLSFKLNEFPFATLCMTMPGWCALTSSSIFYA